MAFLKQVDRCAFEANWKIVGLSAGDRRTLVSILQRLVSKQGAFGHSRAVTMSLPIHERVIGRGHSDEQ